MSFGSDDLYQVSMTLPQLLAERMDEDNLSLRAVSDATAISYSVLMGVVRDRSVPRREEDREALREWLGISERDWSALIAAGAGASADESATVLTLQQLVTRALYEHGLTEQELSDQCDVPYATLMGVTRKGAVPRQPALNAIARVLNLSPGDIAAAVRVTRIARRGVSVQQLQAGRVSKTPGLATLVVERANSKRQSLAAFSSAAGLGYLVVSRLVEQRQVPEMPADRELLREALELDEATFDEACQATEKTDPPEQQPTTGVFASSNDPLLGHDSTPLQQALVGMMRSERLTIKELARRANLSQVTMSRLLKDGQPPARAKTHQNLQKLLGLTADSYHGLLEQSRQKFEKPLSVAKPSTGTEYKNKDQATAPKSEDAADPYQPHDALEPRSAEVPEALVRLSGQLSKEDQQALVELAQKLARKNGNE